WPASDANGGGHRPPPFACQQSPPRTLAGERRLEEIIPEILTDFHTSPVQQNPLVRRGDRQGIAYLLRRPTLHIAERDHLLLTQRQAWDHPFEALQQFIRDDRGFRRGRRGG